MEDMAVPFLHDKIRIFFIADPHVLIGHLNILNPFKIV